MVIISYTLWLQRASTFHNQQQTTLSQTYLHNYIEKSLYFWTQYAKLLAHLYILPYRTKTSSETVLICGKSYAHSLYSVSHVCWRSHISSASTSHVETLYLLITAQSCQWSYIRGAHMTWCLRACAYHTHACTLFTWWSNCFQFTSSRCYQE